MAKKKTDDAAGVPEETEGATTPAEETGQPRERAGSPCDVVFARDGGAIVKHVESEGHRAGNGDNGPEDVSPPCHDVEIGR